MNIRRKRSNLSFGQTSRTRRRSGLGLFFLWLLSIIVVIIITLRFSTIQVEVMEAIYGTATPTTSAPTLAGRADEAFHSGHIQDAADLYRQAVEKEPLNLDINFQFVRTLIFASFEGSKYTHLREEALAVAQKMVEEYPSDARAQAMYALALVENGQAAEAVTAGLRATDLAPRWAEAHAYLSKAYRLDGRWEQALESGDYAVQLDANSVDARYALAEALAFIGNFDRAIEVYTEAIQLAPYLDTFYFELAFYYLAEDNYDAAIASYDRVLSLNPSSVKAYTRKCETYFRQRDDARAEEACRQAILLDSTYVEAWRQLGKILYLNRRYAESIEAFDSCAAIQQENNTPLEDREIECWYLRGLAYYLLEDCESAIPLLRESLTYSPSEEVEKWVYVGIDGCQHVVPAQQDNLTPTPTPPETPDTVPVF